MPAASDASSASGEPPLRAEADFARLFDLCPDLLCVAGLDGHFRRINAAWTHVLGWSQAELLSRPVVSFVHPDDRERTLEARAGLGRGMPVRGLENRYLCKDGSYRWLSWQSVTEPGANIVFAIARDITERRQLEHEHLVKSKLECTGILAGGLAHDFNNLLTSVALNLEMISLTGATNTEQTRHLRQAREAVHTAKSLTDRLLEFATGGPSTRHDCDLRTLLPAAMEFALSGSGLRTEYRLATDLWPVHVDEAQIARVMRGLLLNAREATPPGGSVRLVADNIVLPAGETPGALGGDCVRIQIMDTGSGIAAEVLPNVFDPYYSTKQRGAQKGMGLGLTLCRIVIEEHGGTIAIESQPRRGTTVTCHLPASRNRASGAGQ